jgi:hypothetical protein
VGLVVQPRAAHVSRRRDGDETLLLGVAIEARHGAQPARDRCPGPAQRLEVAGEALDVDASRPEHRQAAFGAPGDVLAQVQRVGVAGQAAVAGQEPRQRQLLVGAEQLVSRREHAACRDGNVHDGNLQASSRGSSGRDRSGSPSSHQRPPTVRLASEIAPERAICTPHRGAGFVRMLGAMPPGHALRATDWELDSHHRFARLRGDQDLTVVAFHDDPA